MGDRREKTGPSPCRSGRKALDCGQEIQIVIIGGAAAGIELARKLGVRYGRKRHHIILIDRNRCLLAEASGLLRTCFSNAALCAETMEETQIAFSDFYSGSR